MPLLRTALLAAALLMLPSCATTGSETGGAPNPRDLITAEQLRERNHANLYDAIRQLRPTWLSTRGVDSMEIPGGVRVYLDNVRLGDVETLRNLTPHTVRWIRYYDGLSATNRWGTDHGDGVIYVSTVGAP